MILLNPITAAVSCFSYLRCEISNKKLRKHCSTRTSRDVKDQWVIKDGKYPRFHVETKLDFKKS